MKRPTTGLATAAAAAALGLRTEGLPRMDDGGQATERGAERDAETREELRFLRRVLIVAGVVAFALLLWQAVHALLLLCAAALVAVLLRGLAGLIGRAVPRLGDGARVALAGGVVLLVLGLAAWLVGDALRTQAAGLMEALPDALRAFERRFGLSLPDDVSEAATRLAQDQDPGRIASAAGAVLQRALGFGAVAVDVLGGLLLAVVGGVFLAADPGLYRHGVVALFPRAERPRVEDALRTAGRALRLWLIGQLVAMALVGALYGLGAWWLGLPSQLALGVFAGLAEFVPVIGPILGALPVLLVALGGGWVTLLWALGLVVVVQQLESNMLMPLVQRRMVQIPPAVLLFSVVVAGAVFGLLGTVLAGPLTVLAYAMVAKLYVRETLGQPAEVPGEKAPGEQGSG
jgi:predicted PurR-regulated permease PerM